MYGVDVFADSQLVTTSRLRRHQVDAPLDDPLFELNVRDAVHQQAADAVGSFIDRDCVAGSIELLCRRESLDLNQSRQPSCRFAASEVAA